MYSWITSWQEYNWSICLWKKEIRINFFLLKPNAIQGMNIRAFYLAQFFETPNLVENI